MSTLQELISEVCATAIANDPELRALLTITRKNTKVDKQPPKVTMERK